MTRQPDTDERLVVPARSVPTEERVYLRELAKYLHHNGGAIRRFGKRRNLLHRVSRGGGGHGAEEYFSPYGAMRVIAFFRALQGASYMRGRPFHEGRASNAAAELKRIRRKRAERLRLAEAALAQLNTPSVAP